MSGKWFSNRGQMIQVTCAVAAVAIGIITQWDKLSGVLGILQVLAYPVAALVLLNIGSHISARSKATIPTPTPAPAVQPQIANEPKPPKITYRYETPTLKVGTFYVVDQPFGVQRVTLVSIKQEKIRTHEVLVAEIDITGGMVDLTGGAEVKQEGRRRFFIPANDMRSKYQDSSAFEFVYREVSLEFFAICVDHINQPAQEVSLVVCVISLSKT